MADLTVSSSSTNGNNEDQFPLKLPKDVFNHVVTFLSHRVDSVEHPRKSSEITRAALTCCSLQKASYSNIVWKAFAKSKGIELRLCTLAEKAKVQEDNEVKQEEFTVQKKRVNSVRDFVLFHENLEKQVVAYLSGGISSFSFEDLPYLSVLHLEGKRVNPDRLVEVLQACKNLKVLKLSDCGIQGRLDLRKSLKLEEVDVSGNKDIKLVDEAGKVLLPDSIRSLNVYNCRIQGRFNLQEFPHLEEVDVSLNAGIELVDEAGKVMLPESIRILDVIICRIEGRFNLQGLPHLEEVYVSENENIELVDEAGKVMLPVSIRRLGARDCGIRGPLDLSGLLHLEVVFISRNQEAQFLLPEGTQSR